MTKREYSWQLRVYLIVFMFSLLWVAFHSRFLVAIVALPDNAFQEFFLLVIPILTAFFGLMFFAINHSQSNVRASSSKENVRSLSLKVSTVFCITALATSGFVVIELDRDRTKSQSSARIMADSKINAFYSLLRNAEFATKSLAWIVKKDNGTVDNFPAVAHEFLTSTLGITNLQLAPDGIIKQIVPLKGNESAIGHNLLLDPKRNKEAFEAVRDRKITLAGPFELIQGGVAVIARMPVYIDDKFWGFTSALMILEDLLQRSKISELVGSGYLWSLSRIHPDTGRIQTFAGNHEFNDEDSINLYVRVPNSTWALNIYPVSGWISVFKTTFSLLFILVTVNLISLLVLTSIRQPQILSNAVNRRTKELADEQLLLIQTQQISKTGSWKMDLISGNFTASNEFYKIYDLPRLSEDTIPFFYDHIFPEDRHKIANIQGKLFAGSEHNIELRLVKNNEVKWVKETAILQFDIKGNVIGIIGACQDISEIKHQEAEIRLNEERMELTLSGAELGSWDVNLVTGKAFYNRRWYEMLGYSPGELSATVDQFENLMHPDDRKLSKKTMVRHLQNKSAVYKAEVRLKSKNGNWVWIQSIGKVFERDHEGRAIRALGTHLDITDRKVTEERLNTLSLAIENSPVATMVSSNDAKIEYVNPQFSILTGYSSKEVIGRNPNFLGSGKTNTKTYEQMWDTLKSKKNWTGELWNKNKKGELILESISITPVLNERNDIVKYVAVKQDITRKREMEQVIWQQANFDALTNLANRFHFRERSELAMERAKRQGSFALFLFLDLNEFKSINDLYGHDAGDQVLIEFGQRLKQKVRVTDSVSRLGGDEFAVVVETLPSKHQVEVVKRGFADIISGEPFNFKNHQGETVRLDVHASIGCAVYPDDGENYDALLSFADHSMYTNKREKN